MITSLNLSRPEKADCLLSKDGYGILQRGCVTRTTFESAERYAAALVSGLQDCGNYKCTTRENVLWIDTKHTKQSFQQTCLRVLEKAGHNLEYGQNKWFMPYWFTPIEKEKRLQELRNLVKAYSPGLVIVDYHDARCFDVESLRQIAAANNCHITIICSPKK